MQIEVSTIFSQAGATLSGLVSRTQDLVSKLRALQLDRHEFVCLKYLVLFNPGEVFIYIFIFKVSVVHLYMRALNNISHTFILL